MKIKIPKGWYKLHPNTKVIDGDMYFGWSGKWDLSSNVGYRQSRPYIYIRKLSKKKK